MFGARGDYLQHFELTIPEHLYSDWHRCFVFHRLALETIKSKNRSPVWIGDKRISIASASSIDHSTVDLNKGEMSFEIFDLPDPDRLDKIVIEDPCSIDTLQKLAQEIGPNGLPLFLVDYLRKELQRAPGSLAIHTSTSIEGYGKSANLAAISRARGFLGEPQLERKKFPDAKHHIKVLYNGNGKARVFYKNEAGAQFVENVGS